MFLLATSVACGRVQSVIQMGHLVSVPVALPVKDTLNVAVGDMVSPVQTVATYRKLEEYLALSLHRPVRLVLRANYTQVNELVRDGKVDLAFVCSFPYVVGYQQFGMRLLAVPVVRGRTTYQSEVIVRRDSPFRSLGDLRGRTFAFTDPLSFSGYLAPTYLLWRRGWKAKSFFRSETFTYSHNRSIRAVESGWVDGAAVDSLVLAGYERDHHGTARHLSIIAASPAVGAPPVVVPNSMASVERVRLLRAFLDMPDSSLGREALRDLGVDGFQPASDAAYNPIRRMAGDLRWRY